MVQMSDDSWGFVLIVVFDIVVDVTIVIYIVVFDIVVDVTIVIYIVVDIGSKDCGGPDE